jgi:hypothetical protein
MSFALEFDGSVMDLRYEHLFSTLGKIVIPQGRSEWHLVTDSPTPGAAAVWMPTTPDGFTVLASFEVIHENGRVKVAEIRPNDADGK